jgi:hypothetical protein
MADSLTHDELLALTPARYLARGYRDEKGMDRAELRSLWALAAAEQLRAAGVGAEDFEPVVAALAAAARDRRGEEAAPERKQRLHRALAGRKLPSGAEKLVRACIEAVSAPGDLSPFAQHLGAVLRLLALTAATREADASLPKPPK